MMMPDRADISWGVCLAILLVVGGLAYLPLPAPGSAPVPASRPSTTGYLASGEWIETLDQRMTRRAEAFVVDTAQDSPLDRYELIGLVESEGANWALISDGQSSLTLRVGGVLEGFELIRVDTDQAVFVSNGNEVVLNLAQ
jgi:hypothetical protein